MSWEFGATVAFIVLTAVIGLPIGHAMLGAAVFYLLLVGADMSIAFEQMLNGLYGSYVLLAIPLFIFAADLMNVGSLSDRLLDFCRALVGRFRGGLGHVNVVSSLIFSGMSGSAIADAVGMGRIIINLMTKDGKYPGSYAGAITAASAIIGPIIPPSIPMVLYALVSDTSIGFLFLGGVVPGLILGILLMVMNAWQARIHDYPVDDPVPLRKLPMITLRAVPALLMPVILLVGIYGGVTTPTEAAALAALYAFIVSTVFYRSVSLRQAYQTVRSSAKSTASVGFLIASLVVFVVSATIAIYVQNWGLKYTTTGKKTLQEMTRELWTLDTPSAKRMCLQRIINTTITLREGNDKKAAAAQYSVILQVAAILLLGIALVSELTGTPAPVEPTPNPTVCVLCNY